jgi:2-polyprenyl-3-methyl-5-hydroxy-6-metoxy-1,4-benzoquinol methylase
MNKQSLIEEQISYYRARSSEYDEWFLRVGKYDRGEEHRKQWNNELDFVRQKLTSFAPFGDTLEIACGTGQWTQTLAEASETLTAVDSVAETIELNRRKNPDANITYTIADIFEWEPKDQYDIIFFGFWLSHVPHSHFDNFWETVRKALKPDGKVFFVDSLKTQTSTAKDHHELDDSGVVERRLNSGNTFKIVKRFYQPEQLQNTLSAMGWTGEVQATEEFFLFGNVYRTNNGE